MCHDLISARAERSPAGSRGQGQRRNGWPPALVPMRHRDEGRKKNMRPTPQQRVAALLRSPICRELIRSWVAAEQARARHTATDPAVRSAAASHAARARWQKNRL